jgi:3-oxoacyl-(acyl-carrier-protein) synthase
MRGTAVTSSMGDEVTSAAVTGLGWIAGGSFAAERLGLAGSFQDLSHLRDELLERGVLASPIRRFAKLDDACRMACLVAALTLHDAGVACSGDGTHDIAVLGTNERGCLETNRAFYADYLRHERRSGRGSLFVYTLPSIPASEVSMHFKLVGPTAWLGSAEARGLVLLDRAEAMLRRDACAAVLCLDVSESGGVGLLLGRAPDGRGASADLTKVRSSAPSLATLEPIVDVVRRAFRA